MWSGHNIMMRAVVTTIYMILITLIACLIPFFGCVLRPQWCCATNDASASPTTPVAVQYTVVSACMLLGPFVGFSV